MLATYQAQVAQLLQNPSAPVSLYSTSALTSFINTARSQIAAEGQCIRVLGTLALNSLGTVYQFSQIGGLGSAVAGVLNVRMMTVLVNGANQFVNNYSWEWFNRYLTTGGVVLGVPTVWAQYGQGASGSVIVYPIPNSSYTANLDCVCQPQTLTTDASPEAVPYPWTDCVQFLAAYFALLATQSNARQADATRMWDRYTEFMARARRFSTPTVLPRDFAQSGVVQPARVQAAPRGA